MATRLDASESQVHSVPSFTLTSEMMDAGGCFSMPDLRLPFWDGAFSGTDKVRRTPQAFLRQIATSSLTDRANELQIVGPTVTYGIVLTDEEAGYFREYKWFHETIAERIAMWGTLCTQLKVIKHVLHVTLPAAIADAISTGVLRTSQERTDVNAVASTPVHTRLDALYDKPTGDFAILATESTTTATILAHKAAMHFAAAMVACGRAYVEGASGCLDRYVKHDDDSGDDIIVQDDDQAIYDSAVEQTASHGPVIRNRESEAPARELRDSVEVRDKTGEELQYELEKGIRHGGNMPNADYALDRTEVAQISPGIVECCAPMETNSKANEHKAVQRHLAAGTRHEYTDKAEVRFNDAADLVGKVIAVEFSRDTMFYGFTLPNAWSEVLKEIVVEEASNERLFKLAGFIKSGEIGLEPTKRPRLIGSTGPMEAGANAEFISLFEQMFKEVFPGFVTKGLDLEATDDKLRLLLQDNVRLHRTLASCDFAAMDSSWFPFEKQRIRTIVRDSVTSMIDVLTATVKTTDPTDLDRIRWRLKELVVEVGLVDMILFSGERGTSIYNRLLVLILRTAEITRFRGAEAALNMWAHARRSIPRSEGDVDVGDGDDTVFDARDYKNAEEIVDAYKAYGKTIEPVLSSTSLEVLSRYCHLSAKGKFYALVKPKKNVQRVCYARRVPTSIIDGQVPDRLTSAKEHAEFATALFQRAFAAAGTPVVRRLCLAAGNYQRRKAEERGSTMVTYTADDLRRRPALKEREARTLREMEAEAVDYVEQATCNSFVMVHWLHFPYGTKTTPPTGKHMVAVADEWSAADKAMAEVVIQDEDLVSPESFMRRCHMTKQIAEAIGVTNPILLKCCPLGVVPSAAARPAGGKGKGKNNDLVRGDQTETEAGGQRKHGTANRDCRGSLKSAKSSGRGKGKQRHFAGQAGRSRTRGVAPSGNTGGMATVP